MVLLEVVVVVRVVDFVVVLVQVLPPWVWYGVVVWVKVLVLVLVEVVVTVLVVVRVVVAVDVMVMVVCVVLVAVSVDVLVTVAEDVVVVCVRVLDMEVVLVVDVVPVEVTEVVVVPVVVLRVAVDVVVHVTGSALGADAWMQNSGRTSCKRRCQESCTTARLTGSESTTCAQSPNKQQASLTHTLSVSLAALRFEEHAPAKR
mmetsp:Transcript_73284/g.184630  ORF Transcript_73284/g.184630 Transcript_73284/m.184630 type:complete len:202 (-) Transcript_73284:73-678(-)